MLEPYFLSLPEFFCCIGLELHYYCFVVFGGQALVLFHLLILEAFLFKTAIKGFRNLVEDARLVCSIGEGLWRLFWLEFNLGTGILSDGHSLNTYMSKLSLLSASALLHSFELLSVLFLNPIKSILLKTFDLYLQLRG